jgi:hypothetical protein
MRLIDADALKERLEQISIVADHLYEMGINRGLDRAETAIDMMPTVDIKTEVAREIFAEIEGIARGELKSLSLFKEDEDDFYMGEIHAIEKLLAELKKKYTKGGVICTNHR